MGENKTFKIRPAGRHILTIGRDLIKDDYAAIVELVKNAYDADAKNVKIDIKKTTDGKNDKIAILVEDDGHGMTYDVVTNIWLVPSTDDKLNRKTSPKGRIMQGKKGIGRYAASVLGNELLLDTTDMNGNNTTILLDWTNFEKAKFIDDVEILIEKKQTKGSAYTKILAIGNKEYAKLWNIGKIDTLKLELKKLISQFYANKEEFEIILSYSGFDLFTQTPQTVKIEPINILEYFDYRISGYVEGDKVSLIYENHKKGMNELKNISLLEQQKGKAPNIGKVDFDIRVYDRDKESIEYMMKKVPTHEKANFLSVTSSKAFLDKFIGVNVYRNGFRIRPLGDPGYDWLKLDEHRVQNPTMRIGLNQVIGSISIENEDKSNLFEKSARDGLKENDAYNMLVKLFENVIWELEDRRYKFRHNAINKEKTQKSIDILSDTEGLKKAIEDIVKDDKTREKLAIAIDKDQAEKQKAVDDLVQKIAIYQGQATLGKIIDVVLHEGRKPLGYFSNQTSNIEDYINLLKQNYSADTLNKIIIIMGGIKSNTKMLAELFGRLDPLASGRRGKKKQETLAKIIENGFRTFTNTLRENDIKDNVVCNSSIKIECWSSDISIIFTNMIENSVHWLKEDTDNKNKEISVLVSESDDEVTIDFVDNGLGISEENIDSGVIFDPGYSTKPNGTGLGLALAGEASERNNGKLEAHYVAKGAYFKLTFSKGKKNENFIY